MTISIDSASAGDLPAILRLLEAQKLPVDGLADHLGTTLVAREDGQVVGSVAIEVYPDGGLLRSVAVDAALQARASAGCSPTQPLTWPERAAFARYIS